MSGYTFCQFFVQILGIFKTTIAGIYSVNLNTFAHYTQINAKLDVFVRKSDESGERAICAAHVHEQAHGAASCATLVELALGDELFCKGLHDDNNIFSIDWPLSSFQAYLLYKA